MKDNLLLLLILLFLFSCKSKSPEFVEPELLEFKPSSTCEEINKFNLNNSILFFEVKGLVDDKTYNKLPDKMLKEAILMKPAVVSAIKKSTNFYIINGECEEGKLLMEVYNIQSFPTIIRTNLSGNIESEIIGITSVSLFEKKILKLDNQ